jgi:hypothetical protein
VTTPNPLVAERQDSTTAITGIGIAESAVDVYNGISSGSWLETGLGVAGTGLETLGLVLDPVGTLLQYGISWLIEHVKPLSDALDWLAGDPDTIASYAQTWRNAAGAVSGARDMLTAAVAQDTAAWTGAAADAYRQHTSELSEQLSAASTAATTVGTVVEVVGMLVGVVRELVRDLVAECVATLIARIPQWLAEEGLSLGLATPHVVASAVALISKWVKRIGEVIQKLVRSIEKLRPLLRKLDEIWAAIKRAVRGGAPHSPRTPGHGPGTPDTPNPVRNPDADVTSPSASPDGTPPTSTPAARDPVAGTPTTPDGSPATPDGTTPASTSPTATADTPTAPRSADGPGGPGPSPTTPATADAPTTDAPTTGGAGGAGGGTGSGGPPVNHGSPDSPGIPPDPRRPHTLETVPEHRVTRDGNGLITEVDGRPVRDYLSDVTQQRADRIRQLVESGQLPRNDVGPVSSVGIDRRTGEVFEAVNGRPRDIIPDDQLHPLLRQRLDEMRANGPYQQYDRATGEPMMRNGQPVTTPYPYPDNPLRHAEVKIVNEMLWRRGADADASALGDFRVDNTFPLDRSGPRPAPCCANCNVMIDGVPSNAGRLTHPPGHPNLQELPE